MLVDPFNRPLTEKRGRSKATIADAQYHPLYGQITLAVVLPDGSRRSMVIPKSCFRFHGKDYQSVTREEGDREMEKLAELFRRKRGQEINLDAYPQQAQGEQE